MISAISLIKKDLKRHKVNVSLNGNGRGRGKTCYLVLMVAKTSLLADLKNTYGKEFTPVHLKLAKKIFGEKETDNTYGVLVDENLTPLFAFNRQFADYDRSTRTVIFKDLDSILVDRVEVKKGSVIPEIDLSDLHIPQGGERRRFPGFEGMHVLLKYSLVEKKKP